MALRDIDTILGDGLADPFSSRMGETSMVPFGRSGDLTLSRPSAGLGGDDFFDSPRRSGGATYQSSSRDDVYYSSRGGLGGSGSSSMQVELSTTSEEDTSSLRVRRREVTTPPVETYRSSSYTSTESSGGGYRETYKPGKRSWLTCRRKPEVTSREAYSFSTTSSDRMAGGGGLGGGTYTSITSDYTTDSKDRYRVSMSDSYTRY